MTFVATANPPIAADDAQVDNDPWFPAVPAARVREVCRLDGTVTAARLGEAISNAMDSVNRELQAYKAEQVLAGAANLAAAGDGRQPGRYQCQGGQGVAPGAAGAGAMFGAAHASSRRPRPSSRLTRYSGRHLTSS